MVCLGRFDDYACGALPKVRTVAHTKPHPDAFELPQADREMFGKFVLSVLWRASISQEAIASSM